MRHTMGIPVSLKKASVRKKSRLWTTSLGRVGSLKVGILSRRLSGAKGLSNQTIATKTRIKVTLRAIMVVSL